MEEVWIKTSASILYDRKKVRFLDMETHFFCMAKWYKHNGRLTYFLAVVIERKTWLNRKGADLILHTAGIFDIVKLLL